VERPAGQQSQRHLVALSGGFDAGARHQLLHQRRDRQRVRIPVAAAVLDLREGKLQPLVLVRLGRLGHPRQQSGAKQALSQYADEIATMHKN